MTDVLVTGSAGLVGRSVITDLAGSAWKPRHFDLVDGDDVRDAAAVRAALEGCDAVVHAGAVFKQTAESADHVVETILMGTWNVLSAAHACGVSRVVYLSSAVVFGFADGEGEPAYLPVDDRHPLRSTQPYGMSKRLSEDMCEIWTQRTGIPTIVLRPVWVLDDDDLTRITADDADYRSFVHVVDVARAVRRALEVDVPGDVRMTVEGPGPFDTSFAEKTLGWRATRSWPEETSSQR